MPNLFMILTPFMLSLPYFKIKTSNSMPYFYAPV
jgi:hypothetical protein